VQGSPGERRAAGDVVGGEDVMTSRLVSVVIGDGVVVVEVVSVVFGNDVTSGVAVVAGGSMLLAKGDMERPEVGAMMVIEWRVEEDVLTSLLTGDMERLAVSDEVEEVWTGLVYRSQNTLESFTVKSSVDLVSPPDPSFHARMPAKMPTIATKAKASAAVAFQCSRTYVIGLKWGPPIRFCWWNGTLWVGASLWLTFWGLLWLYGLALVL
jgi:hypothetical protein